MASMKVTIHGYGPTPLVGAGGADDPDHTGWNRPSKDLNRKPRHGPRMASTTMSSGAGRRGDDASMGKPLLPPCQFRPICLAG